MAPCPVANPTTSLESERGWGGWSWFYRYLQKKPPNPGVLPQWMRNKSGQIGEVWWSLGRSVRSIALKPPAVPGCCCAGSGGARVAVLVAGRHATSRRGRRSAVAASVASHTLQGHCVQRRGRHVGTRKPARQQQHSCRQRCASVPLLLYTAAPTAGTPAADSTWRPATPLLPHPTLVQVV